MDNVRTSLPSIGQLDMSSIKREEAELQAAHTMVTMTPQSTAALGPSYPGPPPPYTYAASTNPNSSGPRTATVRTSPKYPFSAASDEKQIQPRSAPAKQSLPSLSEAMSQSRPADSYERTPRSPPFSYRRRSASPQSAPYAPVHEDYRRRDNDMRIRDTVNGATPYESPRYAPEPHHQVSYGPIRNASPSSPRHVPHSHWSTNKAAPSHAPFSGRNHTSEWASQQRPAFNMGPRSPSFAARPYIHAQQHSSQRYSQTNGSPRYVTSYPALATSTLSGDQGPVDESPDDKYGKGPQYAESVKRQLENFDLEASLNDVCENGHNVMQFGESFRIRTHQAHRSGRNSMSQPSMEEVKQALQYSSHIHEALSNILDRLEVQEAERAERSTKEAMDHQHTAPAHGDVTTCGQSESLSGGFSEDAIKKRRGRAAPPGRCHSCNRAETPEWRRGPDGARTLCNACGLHYAKLTRKMGANKTPGTSNLRQKPLP